MAASLVAEQALQEPQLAGSRAGAVVWHTGPAVSWLVKSSHTRNRSCVLSISRPTPVHWTTKEIRDKSLNPDCAGLTQIFGSSKDLLQICLKDVILNIDNLTIQRGLSQHHVRKQKLGRNVNIRRRKKLNP